MIQLTHSWLYLLPQRLSNITCERVSAAAIKALASSLSRSTANDEESHII